MMKRPQVYMYKCDVTLMGDVNAEPDPAIRSAHIRKGDVIRINVSLKL